MLTEDMNVARAARPSGVVEGYKCPPISANPPTAVNPRKKASLWSIVTVTPPNHMSELKDLTCRVINKKVRTHHSH